MPKSVYIQFYGIFKDGGRNFELNNFELESGFCSFICFVVPVYIIMAWNLADVDYFTLIGNIMIIVQYIQDVWMIGIYTMKRLYTGK